MATYALLFRDPLVETPEARTPEEWSALFDAFVVWAEQLEQRGVLRGVERLEGPGARVVKRSGGRVVIDGPFAETKETVLGFFLVEAADEAAACAIAAESPLVPAGGAVEVRAVGAFPKPAP